MEKINVTCWSEDVIVEQAKFPNEWLRLSAQAPTYVPLKGSLVDW